MIAEYDNIKIIDVVWFVLGASESVGIVKIHDGFRYKFYIGQYIENVPERANAIVIAKSGKPFRIDVLNRMGFFDTTEEIK